MDLGHTVELGLDGVEALGEADGVVERRVGRVACVDGRRRLELIYIAQRIARARSHMETAR